MKANKLEVLTFIGIVIGIVLGVFIPQYAMYFKFPGTIFLSLLKVLILPVIILSLFLAIAQISSFENLKNLGIKTITYYFSTTTIAVITALILANIFIFNAPITETISKKMTDTNIDMVGSIFSTNIFSSLAKGEILHIVVFVIFFSLAFITLPQEKKQPILNGTNTFYEVVLKLINWVLKTAPIGVLSLVWFTVANFDTTAFNNLKSFFFATAIGAIIHALVSLPLIAKLFGHFNAFNYLLQVKEAIMVSLATASSSATLPISIKVTEDAGVQKKVSNFVLPIGATLNMDGSALYQALLIMLFVSLSGTELSITQQLLLFIFITLSSAGTAGIPSGGIVMMTLVLNMFHIPNTEYYLGLYIMVDRFWDYPITSINVWSDLVGAKTINRFIKS